MTTSLLMSKIVDISAARRRRDRREMTIMTSNHDDKRRETRHRTNARLFVQIVSCADQDLVGTTISCESLDVSANGLRISAGKLIPAGCNLDLWVDNHVGPGKFFLSSEVKWARISKGGCEAGVELTDGSATDIEAWRRQQGA